MDFSEIEKKLNYVFKDKELLRRALTLSSADNNFNNQSLEFLGDAVLEFIVSERIFGFGADEGALTKKRANAVCDNSLEIVSKNLGLDRALIKGCGDTNNKKAVPSAYEAVVAAVYLDGGMGAAAKLVNSTIDYGYEQRNYIGDLQELLQGWGLPCPVYAVKDVGTEQSHSFKASVMVDGKTFTGVAEDKREAKQIAAKNALENIG